MRSIMMMVTEDHGLVLNKMRLSGYDENSVGVRRRRGEDREEGQNISGQCDMVQPKCSAATSQGRTENKRGGCEGIEARLRTQPTASRNVGGCVLDAPIACT